MCALPSRWFRRYDDGRCLTSNKDASGGSWPTTITRTLLGAPDLTTVTRTLLGAPGPTTSDKNRTRVSWPYYNKQGPYRQKAPNFIEIWSFCDRDLKAPNFIEIWSVCVCNRHQKAPNFIEILNFCACHHRHQDFWSCLDRFVAKKTPRRQDREFRTFANDSHSYPLGHRVLWLRCQDCFSVAPSELAFSYG